MTGLPFSAVGVGCLVGLVLGLVGGGGSILATPLLVYVVGVRSPHVAIGTSAFAVGLSALANLVFAARRDRVDWTRGGAFSSFGVAGAIAGAAAGKAYDGRQLLLAFGVLMLCVAALTALGRGYGIAAPAVPPPTQRRSWPRLIILGLGVGGLSGFFGIGGGVLSTPALAATGLPLEIAAGSSLVAVCAFGLVTAASYATSGLVDWQVAALFALGAPVGGWAGAQLSSPLKRFRNGLRCLLTLLLIATGALLIVRAT